MVTQVYHFIIDGNGFVADFRQTGLYLKQAARGNFVPLFDDMPDVHPRFFTLFIAGAGPAEYRVQEMIGRIVKHPYIESGGQVTQHIAHPGMSNTFLYTDHQSFEYFLRDSSEPKRSSRLGRFLHLATEQINDITRLFYKLGIRCKYTFFQVQIIFQPNPDISAE